MADISITAANCLPVDETDIVAGKAGETITAGQILYKASADGRWYKADANAATAEARKPIGVALNGASAGQPISVQRSGRITIGGTLTAGVTYYLSDTPGGVAPLADVASGEYYAVLGVAQSTTVLLLGFSYSGVSA